MNRDDIECIVLEVFREQQQSGVGGVPVTGMPHATSSEILSSAVPDRARAAVLVEKKRLDT